MPTIAPHIWPIPVTFWQRQSIQAFDPTVWYVGPMIHTDADALAIAPRANDMAQVYIVSNFLDCLYVGKTVNLCGRFSKHRHQKEWWPTQGRLVVLGVTGDDRAEAERAAFYVERLAIRDCKPLYNIAGVTV